VWGFGATLYECLTHRQPFRGADIRETLHQVLTESPVPPRQLDGRVPRSLEAICLKCLAKEPHDRYQNCLEL
ncbi:hypothetical protein WFJ45_24445, partial [Salmonella enterica subsp. enterica serovar Minnesota]